MPKAELRSPFAALSGTFAEQTIGEGGRETFGWSAKWGQAVRQWVIPTNNKTPNQVILRAQIEALSGAYSLLTVAEAAAWNLFALGLPSEPGRLGQMVQLSGINAYIRYGLHLWSIAEAASDVPPVYWEIPFGFHNVELTSVEFDEVGSLIKITLATDASIDEADLTNLSFRMTRPLASQAIVPSVHTAGILVVEGTTQIIASPNTTIINADISVAPHFAVIANDVVAVRQLIVSRDNWPWYAPTLYAPVVVTAVA